MENFTTCKNCNSKIDSKFCPNCGQKASVAKVTFTETFQDVINAMFSIDAPLWVTIKALILNPGQLFRNYLSGKRKTYYKPVAFFILTTVIFVLVKAFLNYDPMENVVQADSKSIETGLLNKAGVFMANNINNIIFTFVFSFALMLKLFFYRLYSIAEYLAVSFYMAAFYIILTTVSMFVIKFGDSQLKMIPFVLMLLYVVYALISFFQKKSLLVIVKILLVYFFGILLYIIFGFGISFLIVWLKSN